MMHNNQPLLPDPHGVILMAGCWAPLLAVRFNAAYVGLLMSILVSCLAVVDYAMKIYFKAKQMKTPKTPKDGDDNSDPSAGTGSEEQPNY